MFITTKDGVRSTTRTGAKVSPSCSVTAGRCRPMTGTRRCCSSSITAIASLRMTAAATAAPARWRRSRHGSLCRRPGRADRASRSEERHSCRPFHRRRRGGALSGTARRKPGGEGGLAQRGAAADGEDGGQSERPARSRYSTIFRRSSRPIARNSIATLQRVPSTATTGRAQRSRRPSSTTGGARA